MKFYKRKLYMHMNKAKISQIMECINLTILNLWHFTVFIFYIIGCGTPVKIFAGYALLYMYMYSGFRLMGPSVKRVNPLPNQATLPKTNVR